MRWSIANAAAGAVIAPVALMVRARLIEDIETSSFSRARRAGGKGAGRRRSAYDRRNAIFQN
jgi:hypothetical protein